MFLDFFKRKKKRISKIQTEYIDSIMYILESPLWNKTDEQIYLSLPRDLTQDTINYAKEKLSAQNEK